MSEELLKAIIDKRSRIEAGWPALVSRLQEIETSAGERIPFDAMVPNISMSFEKLNLRVVGALGLIGSIQDNCSTDLIPRDYLSGFVNSLDQMISHVEQLSNQLNGLLAAGKPVSIDGQNFIITAANNSTSINLQQRFAPSISQALDQVLKHYYQLCVVFNGPASADFSLVLGEFDKALKQSRERSSVIREAVNGIRKLEKSAQQHIELIKTLLGESESSRGKIQQARSEAERERQTIAEYQSEVTQKVASIREISKDSDQLRSTVDGYEAQFESFQEQLDRREKALTKGNQELSALIESLDNKEGEVDRLNQQAKAMLGGATVAGLAGEFGRIRNELGEELGKARRAFYVAITLLVVSSIPLALLFFPVLSPPSSASTALALDSSEFVPQALFRFLLIIPAAWLTKFAAARHARLFRLREHYAFKYSVASSVEGFKQQAQELKDGITAATFFQLTFNPADKMEGQNHEDGHPNPAMDWIMRKLGFTSDGKTE